jgi:uncharacterized membrane protein YphA (DoxX/SURF4 family)
VVRGVALIAIGLLLAAWFWFGWAPIRSPAVDSGSDYIGMSPISIAIVALGIVVAGSGIAHLFRVRSASRDR